MIFSLVQPCSHAEGTFYKNTKFYLLMRKYSVITVVMGEYHELSGCRIHLLKFLFQLCYSHPAIVYSIFTNWNKGTKSWLYIWCKEITTPNFSWWESLFYIASIWCWGNASSKFFSQVCVRIFIRCCFSAFMLLNQAGMLHQVKISKYFSL